ncbi:non-histone protein [Mucor velutinosus]|uniref:Non-histone protein n=1 Tax=Mucor velutinosus TaxID=708070 RepID=A0AAN7DIX4_9FUNG|nr:non-histone protein [Mucor velutinosus]
MLANVKQVTTAFCLHLFKVIARKVQPLSVVLNSLGVENDREDNEILGGCADYILNHCRSLKELELCHLSLSSSDDFPEGDELFMDDLLVYECSMSHTFLMVDKMILYRDYILTRRRGFDMPNTVVETLHLFDIATGCVLKIQAGLGKTYRYRYGYDYAVDEKYEKLTKADKS